MEDIKLKCKNKDTMAEDIENYLNDLDIQLANLEKLGSSLLVIGYALFVYGSNIDILDTLGINNTGQTATSITLQGGELILYGYILLFIVSAKRLEEKIFENEATENTYVLSPYQKLYFSYWVAIFMNLLRVSALSELDYLNKSGEAFV
ncbi:hypothetical protein HMPREF0216_02987 [Clostridium celatum DSM 1785]|uniref:Uncharacterized protein n=1 Tax=Clostridium celatum DSM 1785 TaxID=545697 RepID=L1Q6V5_9CLOT|nr:hypothetical protein HMPREF0216_02987 [Clostridium celatum DSM 1785]